MRRIGLGAISLRSRKSPRWGVVTLAEYPFYRADWRDPTHYHLTVDSAVWGEEGTADLILSAFELIPHEP